MAELWVGTGEDFQRLEDAIEASEPGDTIYVRAGTYENDSAYVEHDLRIVGVGGEVRLLSTQNIPNGKAILVTNGDITLENLIFEGATVDDENGAGIRYEGGHLTVFNCKFIDNENGILGASVPDGRVTIVQSEFAENGFGDGQTHGIYINDIASLEILSSYFHDTSIGHHIKSRARATLVADSVLDDGAGGTSSYSVDLPNGGQAVVRDNTIIQSAAGDNRAIIHFGGESEPYPGSSLLLEGNVVTDFHPNGLFLLNHTALVVELVANTLINVESIASGPYHLSDTPPAGEMHDGTATPDTLIGGSGADSLFGQASDDLLSGGGGNDIILGNDGDDIILGGSGNDLITGDLGIGPGNDSIDAGAGNDTVLVQDGADTILGEDGDDLIGIFDGTHTILGGAGNDVILLAAGTSEAAGEAGNDILAIFGGTAQYLSGGDGNDVLFGGGEAPTLDGGAGNDTQLGGAGADLFAFDSGFGPADLVYQFTPGVDQIRLAADINDTGIATPGDALAFAVATTFDGFPTIAITLGGDTIYVVGVTQLSASDIVVG